MINQVKKLFLNTQFKIALVLITMGMIGLIFWSSLDNTATKDEVPSFSALTRSEQRKLGPFFTKVKTGLYIRDFSKFDVINNTFVMDAIVWFEFMPGEVSLETVEKFSFLDGDIRKKSTPDIKMIEGRVFAKYYVEVEFRSDLRFHYYPYDYHKFAIIITNNYVTTSSVVFITSDASFTIDPRISLSNWKIDDYTTDYGFRSSKLDRVDDKKKTTLPMALFIVHFSSNGVKNALIIFIPMLFSLMLGLFSLLIPLQYGERNTLGISFSTASVTSLLGYRFVIERLIPSVGYTTTTDAVYTMALAVVFIPFILQIIAGFVSSIKQEGVDDAKGKVIADNMSVALVSVFFVLLSVTVYLLYKNLII